MLGPTKGCGPNNLGTIKFIHNKPKTDVKEFNKSGFCLIFLMCVVLITELLQLVGRLGPRKLV